MCVWILFVVAAISPAFTSVPSEKVQLCSNSEYLCNDGACVSSDLLCDGTPHCADGSDEMHCGMGTTSILDQSPILNRVKRQTAACRKYEWQCRDSSCISFDGKCDGRVDCPDGSDESHAICRNIRCQSNWFRCTYGACVDGTAPCNGVQECADNSDELLPRCRNETEDIRLEYKCKNGDSIPAASHCDGAKDCADGSDETVEACAGKKCMPYLFQCAYGACVDGGADCNGITECADGSDEAIDLCRPNSTPVSTGPSQVPDNKCQVPPNPKNGVFLLNNQQAKPGAVYDSFDLTIKCNSGYEISTGNSADNSVWCMKNKWKGTVHDCVKACPLIGHPSVIYKCRIKENYFDPLGPCPNYVPETIIVQPECNTGYFSSTSLPYMTCQDGNWNNSPICMQDCGTVVKEGDILTVGGRPVKRGEFPWHVGVYSKNFSPFKQICGGSIVSKTTVISAAHCFYSDLKQKLYPASDYLIAAGKIYKAINSIPDKDSAQKREIKTIDISPQYRGMSTNYQEDIAILTLVSPFEFTNYVRPVCVDFDYRFEKSQLVNGNIGKVAGWGYTSAEDTRGSQELRVVDMPFVDYNTCYQQADTSFQPYLTSDKVCAGKTDGTVALCKGDSGGGLTFPSKLHALALERYYLRGVTSTAPRATDDSTCNIYTFIGFTLISKHEAFIKSKMQ